MALHAVTVPHVRVTTEGLRAEGSLQAKGLTGVSRKTGLECPEVL